MPTQYSRKHTNEASMALWRASTIHHLMAEQVDAHRKSAKKGAHEAPTAATSAAQARMNIAPSLSQPGGKRYGIVISLTAPSILISEVYICYFWVVQLLL